MCNRHILPMKCYICAVGLSIIGGGDRMKRVYYCKQNALFYIIIGFVMLVPLMLGALNHKDYISVDYVIIYISIVFLITGALVFALSSAHISLSKDYIVFYIIGIPFKYISIHSLSEVEDAVKPQFHLFALSKEQIAVSYDNDRVVNLSLYKNDDFLHQVKQLKASECLSQLGDLPVGSMRIIRFVIALFYMTANALLPLVTNMMRYHSLLIFIMMSVANIICLAFYMNTRRN